MWESFFNQHRVGDVVKGKVLRSAQFGTFVEISEGIEGLCHVSEATDATHKPVALEPESEHEFKIIKMNQEEKKVGLSLRAVGEEASRTEVENYKQREASSSPKGPKMKSSTSSSSSTTLGDLLAWKKAENEDNAE